MQKSESDLESNKLQEKINSNNKLLQQLILNYHLILLLQILLDYQQDHYIYLLNVP